MRNPKKKHLTTSKMAIQFAAACAITGGVLSTDIKAGEVANIEASTDIITTNAEPVKCDVKAAQIFIEREQASYDRHGTAALEILKSNLPPCPNVRSINYGELSNRQDVVVESFITTRPAGRPAQLLVFEMENLRQIQNNTLLRTIENHRHNTHGLVFQGAGNNGGQATQAIPYDIDEHFLDPLAFNICSNSYRRGMSKYCTPRGEFSTMEGMKDLDIVQTSYYPNAKELAQFIRQDSDITPSDISLINEWIRAYLQNSTLSDAYVSILDKLLSSDLNTKPEEKKTMVIAHINDLAAKNARINKPNKEVSGTSFAAPEAGNIFINAMIAAQNNSHNPHCGQQLTDLDYVFLAAASTEPTDDLRWYRNPLDRAESAGGAFRFNLMSGGYGWVRAGRLTHLVNAACNALKDNPDLQTQQAQIQQRIIKLGSQNKTVFGIRASETDKKHESLLFQRAIMFKFEGDTPKFAHVSFNGADYRLPVHAAPPQDGKPGVGIVVMKGLIGARSSGYMWIGIRDKHGNKPKNFTLSGKSVEVVDVGVKRGKLWSHMMAGLKDGSIVQAPKCSTIRHAAFVKAFNKRRPRPDGKKIARLCR
ncbi:MAG: hypothetical protein MRY79_03370 [Alphaproteobacteria bacterium]|nr:hypothetical protein [Alphaproteobacteria bacterium]